MTTPHQAVYRAHALAWIMAISVVWVSCGSAPQTPTGPTLPFPTADTDRTPFVPVAAVLPTEIFVGAGDIAQCGDSGSEATAALLDRIGGTVFALGDNAYPSGRTEDYRNCYDPTWGRHKGRTRPAPGNHEYDAGSATPYFEYFGASAGPPGVGYYSFELGNWHVISLNSSIAVGGGSAQAAWLRNDLAANPKACTIAYWHHPLFSSSRHGNQERMAEFWRILYEAGADIVLAGHDHVYERFAQQDASGAPDPVRGIREFIVGTGGAAPYPFVDLKPNSEARLSARGVLRLALKAGGYDWNFVSVSGAGDSGSDVCH